MSEVSKARNKRKKLKLKDKRRNLLIAEITRTKSFQASPLSDLTPVYATERAKIILAIVKRNELK